MASDQRGMHLYIIDCACSELNDAGVFKVTCQVVCFDDALPYPLFRKAYDHLGVLIHCIAGDVAVERSPRDQRIKPGLRSVERCTWRPLARWWQTGGRSHEFGGS